MKLIVGLGNPGPNYKNTYHNLGFEFVDILAQKLNVSFEDKKCKAMIAQAYLNSEKVIIAKPTTYMNLSGDAIWAILQKYSFSKLDNVELIVIYDDVDLPVGKTRIRKSGSAGSHNGMKSIIGTIGTNNFKRIRIGFMKEYPHSSLSEYVLSKKNQEESKLFLEIFNSISENLIEYLKGSINFENLSRSINNIDKK